MSIYVEPVKQKDEFSWGGGAVKIIGSKDIKKMELQVQVLMAGLQNLKQK